MSRRERGCSCLVPLHEVNSKWVCMVGGKRFGKGKVSRRIKSHPSSSKQPCRTTNYQNKIGGDPKPQDHHWSLDYRCGRPDVAGIKLPSHSWLLGRGEPGAKPYLEGHKFPTMPYGVKSQAIMGSIHFQAGHEGAHAEPQEKGVPKRLVEQLCSSPTHIPVALWCLTSRLKSTLKRGEGGGGGDCAAAGRVEEDTRGVFGMWHGAHCSGFLRSGSS